LFAVDNLLCVCWMSRDASTEPKLERGGGVTHRIVEAAQIQSDLIECHAR
jgi:hypothetical protein